MGVPAARLMQTGLAAGVCGLLLPSTTSGAVRDHSFGRLGLDCTRMHHKFMTMCWQRFALDALPHAAMVRSFAIIAHKVRHRGRVAPLLWHVVNRERP
jgi:hypothetical protein